MCVCEHIPSIALETRLVLVLHRREFKKTTNTGVLAARALTNSDIAIWGDSDAPLADDALLPPGHHGVVLTPSEDAIPLDAAAALALPRPVALVVPDGTWRQALKMPRRIPALAALPRVTLPAGPLTRYHLREETHAHGLATFEAIARALGALEGPEVQARLEALFDRYVDATLRTRGRERPDEAPAR